MFLWWVQYDKDEWGCFVIAETRGKAKVMFWRYFHDGWEEYTNIRCYKRKQADGHGPGILDATDDPLLAELGVRYFTQEEMDAARY